MPGLLEGKTALILGVANRWRLAYAIAEAFRREGARLVLTYQGQRQRETVEALGAELSAVRILPCDVTQEQELAELGEALRSDPGRLDAVVHSIAFANREDLSRPFVETSRRGYALEAVRRYLASELGRGVTGNILFVDSGFQIMGL